ncbi:hypothetical protein ENKNEFLB_03505 [Nocardioides aquaticus]|uniref:Peptidase M15C domain-containing protein n=3 Tax=Nocardioides aquaticus TaxID=160826 RepID=A0ABX8EPD6_9ACTN|nr:M15 family metallopeptidase [Nocardioides aquaticus]QVT81098.1 hypothetical protein ENKNEFLB_03505 [Nocardioides aquaticus]
MTTRPRRTSLLVAALVAALAGPLGAAAAPAAAADPAPTVLTLGGSPAHAGAATTLRATLLDEAGTPVVEAPVVVERRTDDDWRRVATVTTDATGAAVLEQVLDRTPRTNAFRASYAGDAALAGSASGPAEVTLRRRHSALTVRGPGSVVDERSTVVRVQWRTRQGEGVPGRVVLMRRDAGGAWRTARRLTTDGAGNASLRTTPRVDTRWRARAAGQAWVRGARSGVHAVDNLPPGEPVRLPGGAPRPRIDLPPQPRAVGDGANPVVTRIPGGVWDQMTGRSWHAGCPVGRSSLRLLRVNYWDFTGYRRRGEMVLHADVAGRVAGALGAMYARQLPIRAMYRVDRFGWSARVRGGDDHASMAADNTSAFNCRDVVNRPGIRSPHSYGRSVDINPWENPYRSATGLVPNTWWQSRTHPRVAWRSSQHPVVSTLAARGLRWTYGTSDNHHFDARPAGMARPLPAPDCGPVACE